MKPIACYLFILVFVVVTTYLLSLVLIHVFSEKIKETGPQAVVVHVHQDKTNGKSSENKFYVTNNSTNSTNSNYTQEKSEIEGFVGHKCKNCSNLFGDHGFQQKITPPRGCQKKPHHLDSKKAKKGKNDKLDKTSKEKKSKKNSNDLKKSDKGKVKVKGKGKENNKGIKSVKAKDNTNQKKQVSEDEHETSIIEGFGGDKYLQSYRKNYRKCQSKLSGIKCNLNAFNQCNYFT